MMPAGFLKFSEAARLPQLSMAVFRASPYVVSPHFGCNGHRRQLSATAP
jgi:hypothetical protein